MMVGSPGRSVPPLMCTAAPIAKQDSFSSVNQEVIHELLPSSSCSSIGESSYEVARRELDGLIERYNEEASSSHPSMALQAELTRALCRLLVARRGDDKGPSLCEWLRLVGLSSGNIRQLQIRHMDSVDDVITASDNDLRNACENSGFSPETKRKFLRSCQNIRSYLIALRGCLDRGETMESIPDKALAWTMHSPIMSKRVDDWRGKSYESVGSPSTPPSPRYQSITPDLPSDGGGGMIGCTYTGSGASSIADKAELGGQACSSSAIPSQSSSKMHSRCGSGSGSLSTSTSACRSHTLSPWSSSTSPGGMGGSVQSTPTLAPSTSRVTQSTSMQFNVNKSPKMSRIVHSIPHKWVRTTKFRINNDAVCHFCQRTLGIWSATEKCSICKSRVHVNCKSKMGDSCGMTPDLLRGLFDKLIQENNSGWNYPPGEIRSARADIAFQYPDINVGDSSSSTNSSAPSTPAIPGMGLGAIHSPFGPTTAPPRSFDPKFTFPDTVPEVPDIVLPENSEDGNSNDAGWSEVVEGASSRSTRMGEGSEGTLVVDSTGSGTETGETEGSTGGGIRSPGGHTWERNVWNTSTIRAPNAQASWNEVTIPFQKIEFKKNPLVGRGRFGDVLRGYHFGDVAVKFLNMDHVDEAKRLEEFKSEVAAYKNARHDNLVLFRGYCCLDADKLGIVMSLCTGKPLHHMLHELNERLDLAASLLLATQICQGVSYLHTKKILHKDLRSKNIFIESKNKVLITDFGLFSMKRLKNPNRDNTMIVPQHWLTYLAPELIRSLSGDWRELPFSETTDVYAFGTIWYEMVTYSFPFPLESPDRIIWMVGNGMKTPFHNVNIMREVKDLLLRCWGFNERPSFGEIMSILNALPKKRLDRSPSFPLIRSYESIF